MYRSMNLKGFLLILGVMLVIFLVIHSALRSSVNRKAEEEKLLRVQKTKLEEEFKALNRELNVVGTDEYIMSSAVRIIHMSKRTRSGSNLPTRRRCTHIRKRNCRF